MHLYDMQEVLADGSQDIGMNLIVILMIYSFMMFLLDFDIMECLWVN